MLLLGGGVRARAQYLVQSDSENVQQRIARARALAAVGNLPAARSELESLRHATNADESVREIASVLLVGVYLEQADYAYAENLLNETFAARQAQRDTATQAYFSLAGQVINGVRTHIERYRALGLDVTDATLPSEATSDLDHLRVLLERVAAQGKQLGAESGRTLEAWALIEEAAGLRTRLARNSTERTQWQREIADARQRIAGADPRLMVSSAPAAARTQPDANTTPASSSRMAPTTTSAPATASSPAPAQSAPAQTNTTAPFNSDHHAAQPVAQTTTNQTSANTTSAPVAAPQPTNAPADSAALAQPLNVGATLIAKAKERVAPSYPAPARSARVAGNVTVFLTVDEKGEVSEVQRTSGPELLRRAAEDAARRWKFNPTIINGQPVRVSGYINFNFAL
jgi:TonB family protein